MPPLLLQPGKTKGAVLSWSTVLCMAVALFLADPSEAARCQAKESCNMGQDCSMCAEVKTVDICTQIASCDWLSSCTAASSCGWFQESVCVLKDEGQGASEDLCKQASSEFCAGMDVCEWKGDCRQCSNFTTNSECVSRALRVGPRDSTSIPHHGNRYWVRCCSPPLRALDDTTPFDLGVGEWALLSDAGL